MGKFGWSLPPGVTNRMIEEAAGGDPEAEAFMDQLFNEFERVFGKITGSATEDNLNTLGEWLWQQIGEAYHKGYQQGMSDEGYAREMQQVGTPT